MQKETMFADLFPTFLRPSLESRRGSFLRMLKTVATVDDYVVVKVDIDSLGVGEGPELAIVESIAHLPELSQLVDELRRGAVGRVML